MRCLSDAPARCRRRAKFNSRALLAVFSYRVHSVVMEFMQPAFGLTSPPVGCQSPGGGSSAGGGPPCSFLEVWRCHYSISSSSHSKRTNWVVQDGACYKDTTVPTGVIAVTQQDLFFFFNEIGAYVPFFKFKNWQQVVTYNDDLGNKTQP